MNKRILSLFSTVLALALAFAGCAGSGGSSSAGAGSGDAAESVSATAESQAANAKDSIVVEIVSDPPVLCAGFQANIVVSMLSDQIFDKLVIDNGDGTYAPNLASSWEFSEDGREITFEIRDDVTFHNGEKMTADDVVFSYNTVINGGYADTSTSAMDRAEKVDESHVKIIFKNVYGPAMVCIATSSMTIFPQAYYEADPDHFLRNPIGTGPYQFVSWSSGDNIRMTRYDGYHMGAAPIKDVDFRIFVDSSVAAIALENGEIDVLTNPQQTDRNLLMNNADITYDETESAMVTWGFFNCGEGQRFSDKRLREAVSYAIDREACMLGAMEGAAVKVNSMYPNFLPMAWPEYEARQYDPEKAKALLADCGYGPENPLKINFQGRETPHYAKPAEVMQQQLAEVGIEMTLEKLEAGAWSDDVLRKSNFEFNLICTTIGFLDFYERYSLFVTGQPQNFYNVANADLDDAFNRNRNSNDEEERRQACKDIIRIMDEEALIVPIYGNMRGIAYRNGLKGIAADSGYRYYINEWSF